MVKVAKPNPSIVMIKWKKALVANKNSKACVNNNKLDREPNI